MYSCFFNVSAVSRINTVWDCSTRLHRMVAEINQFYRYRDINFPIDKDSVCGVQETVTYVLGELTKAQISERRYGMK